MSLEVTNVRVNKFNSTSKVKAFATVTFNDALVVDGFKVIEGSNGAFLGMPSKPGAEQGKYSDIAYFTDKAVKQAIQDRVLAEYSGGSAPAKTTGGGSSQIPSDYNFDGDDDDWA